MPAQSRGTAARNPTVHSVWAPSLPCGGEGISTPGRLLPYPMGTRGLDEVAPVVEYSPSRRFLCLHPQKLSQLFSLRGAASPGRSGHNCRFEELALRPRQKSGGSQAPLGRPRSEAARRARARPKLGQVESRP